MIWGLSIQAGAAQYKGYAKEGAPPATAVFTETIERLEETSKEHLIFFSHHSALYRLPKTTSYDSDLVDFLRQRRKKKTPVEVEYSPVDMKIFKISDPNSLRN
jgi:hypothetical protein